MVNPTVFLLALLLGVGLLLVGWALVRPSRPDLSILLRPPSPAIPASSVPASGWEMRMGTWLAPRMLHPRLRILIRPPLDDLKVLGRPVELWLTQKIVLAMIGLAAPTLVTTAAALLGLRIPVAIPLVVALAAAVVLFLLPDWVVRDAAADARREFRHAAAIYIGWVAQARSAAGGPAESLERAAAVG
jgi:hypothetical protein